MLEMNRIVNKGSLVKLLDVKYRFDNFWSRIDFSEDFVIDVNSNICYSHQEIFVKAKYIADNALDDENIVILENGISLLIVYFAAMIGNKIIIPIDPEKSEAEINHIKKIHPTAKVIDKNYEFYYGKYSGSQIDKEIFHSIDYDKDYIITYTSGSSGTPKGVVHSLGNLLSSAFEFAELMQYDSSVRMCHVMPMTYMAGILNTIILPFIVGGKIILMPRFSVKTVMSFWRDVINNSVNTFWLSPTMLNLLMKVDRGDVVKNYILRIKPKISIGTAALSEVLRAKFESKYGIKIYPSYGLSETLFISSDDGSCINKASVGRVLKSVDIRYGIDNEMLLNVPWMFKRYINIDNDDYFTDNFYKSGDLGKCDNDELQIIGRKKDVIVKGGFNIYPSDIERIVARFSGVSEVCVGSIKVNDEEGIICWYSGISLEKNSINKKIIKELGEKYKIDYLVKLASLPKNLNGKIDKLMLVSKYSSISF